MLQRIQSLFLILVAGFMLSTLFFPLWTISNPGTGETQELFALFLNFRLDMDSGLNQGYIPFAGVGIFCLLAAFIALYETFKFKNRLTQMKLGALNAVVMAISIGLAVWFATDAQKAWTGIQVGQYGVGFYFTPAAMLCNILANRLIRRDERLVRSVNRIR